ncbi:MAG: DUF3221 domain-containing protein [Patescibacteria group bacterium]
MFKENIKYIIIVLLVSIFLGYNFYIADNHVGEEATIKGFVYEINEESFLVAEGVNSDNYEDLEDLEGEAIAFSVTDDTEFINKGEEASFEDLNLKDEVKVWNEGPIMESYPAQTEAKKVEIIEKNESDEREVEMESYQDSEFGLTFDKPKNASVTYEAGRLKITYVGEDSSTGELTDGFTFFIDVLETGDPIEGVARRMMDNMEFAEIVSTISEEEIDGLEGQSFTIKTGLGNEAKYFIYRLNDETISTSRSIIDPNEKGYADIAEDILLSIDLEESVSAEKKCKVSGCSGEICGLETRESTCEFLPGMDCIELAECEMADGECGWTLNEEAANCFIEVLEDNPDADETRIGHFFEKAKEVIN